MSITDHTAADGGLVRRLCAGWCQCVNRLNYVNPFVLFDWLYQWHLLVIIIIYLVEKVHYKIWYEIQRGRDSTYSCVHNIHHVHYIWRTVLIITIKNILLIIYRNYLFVTYGSSNIYIYWFRLFTTIVVFSFW